MNLDPTLWAERAVASLLLVTLFVGGGFVWGHHVGTLDVAKLKAQYAADTARANAEASAKYDAAVKAADRREQALQTQLATIDTQRQEEKSNYETALSDLRTRALAGDVRLRATVAPRAIPQCTAATNPASAGRSGETETADLVPTTVDAILGIAGRINQDVRDYNALLNHYNAAVAACNAP